MWEKIGIRYLVQFLVICIIRLFLTEGYASTIDIKIAGMIFLYAFLFTLILECFDELILDFVKYYKVIIAFLSIIFIGIMVGGCSLYIKLMIGYLLVVMLKDVWKISSIQLSLMRFQKEYKEKNTI